VVGEKGEAGAEAGAEGRLHLRRIDADGHEAAVGDFELVLELDESAEVPLLLGTPPSSAEEESYGVAAG
jgi:hypothetical protein